MRKLFGIGVRSACPLANLSRIYVDVSNNETSHTYQLVPEPSETLVSLRGGQENKIAIYDVRSHSVSGMFNVAIVHTKTKVYGVEVPPVFFANRYIVGECLQCNSFYSFSSLDHDNQSDNSEQ